MPPRSDATRRQHVHVDVGPASLACDEAHGEGAARLRISEGDRGLEARGRGKGVCAGGVTHSGLVASVRSRDAVSVDGGRG